MDVSDLTGANIITKYKVYYGTSSGSYTTVKDDVGTATSYTVTGLSGKTKLSFLTENWSDGSCHWKNKHCYFFAI
jgi:hypothetical protein